MEKAHRATLLAGWILTFSVGLARPEIAWPLRAAALL